MMETGSVISISSTSSKGSPTPSLLSCLTESLETQRVPVSYGWESPKVSKRKSEVLDSEVVQSHCQKVKNWIKNCKYEEESSSTNNVNKTSCVRYDFDANISGTNRSTCIRYDFDKSTKFKDIDSPQKSCFTVTKPLFSYMNESKMVLTDNLVSPRPNGNNVSDTTPLSPESQKKELCSYLQLMKPEEKKKTFFLENRRSNRVKRLIQHNKCQENPKTCSENDVKRLPTLKIKLERSHIKTDLFDLKSLKNKKISDKYFPLQLPPSNVFNNFVDFEDSVMEIVTEVLKSSKERPNGCLRKVGKKRRLKLGRRPLKKFITNFSFKRINSLRSKGRLRNKSLDSLILRKSRKRRKAREKMLQEIKQKQLEEKEKGYCEIVTAPPSSDDEVVDLKNLVDDMLELDKRNNTDMEINRKQCKEREKRMSQTPHCEIVTVHPCSDDENVDLKNFVDDMLELDKMSEEHRKAVIETRILASSSITNLIKKQSMQEADVQKAYKIFSDLSEKRNEEEKENKMNMDEDKKQKLKEDEKNLVSLISAEHDYASSNDIHRLTPSSEDQETEEEDEEDEKSLSPVPIPPLDVLPVNTSLGMKSLHRSLTLNNKRKLFLNNYWGSGPNCDNRKMNHAITISKKDGSILGAFYQDLNLVIVQENLVSFWTQSALGNILGAQNMWIPKGHIQRITLNSTYLQKHAVDMVISTETSLAYVELWTKEHKSDLREVPVADVFTTVYFWRLRQSGLEKKALQLENIKGFSDDVQYCVLKYYQRIIVCWQSAQGNDKKTKIRSYHLAADFQTVANISEIQPVEHYISSLHNIEDCDSLVMGCGENKVTLWNVEYGYVVATVELSNIKSALSTLWVKCDRGFLFTVQECVDQELRLIAINGMNHSWKKLQTFRPTPGFDRLKGVCIENGILIAYYSQGILCWNAQTGDPIVEEVPNEGEYIPSGKYVIMILDENIIVRHSLSHLLNDF